MSTCYHTETIHAKSPYNHVSAAIQLNQLRAGRTIINPPPPAPTHWCATWFLRWADDWIFLHNIIMLNLLCAHILIPHDFMCIPLTDCKINAVRSTRRLFLTNNDIHRALIQFLTHRRCFETEYLCSYIYINISTPVSGGENEFSHTYIARRTLRLP